MIIDKSIKRITVGNTDIQRIMHGGGILWQKSYVWKKYECQFIYEEKVRLISENGTAEISESAYFSEKDRKGLQWYGNVGYHIYGGYSIGNSMYRIQYNLKGIKERYMVEKRKGSYIEEVYSYKSSEYPNNGEKGGYWYEFVG